MTTPLTGCCQCGAVHYTVTADPLFTYAYHCSDCQKRTGSAFSMGVIVVTDSLQLEGELTAWSCASDKGDTNTRYSCTSCGNIIHGIGESSPEVAKLQAGTLDDTSTLEPEVHIWTSRKQGWVVLPDRAPQYQTQPEAPVELLQAAVEFRSGN